VYDGGALKFVEKVRAGLVGHMRAELHALMRPLLTKKCPFVNLPEKRRTAWSLTGEEMKNCCWISRTRRTNRVPGVDAGRTLAPLELRGIAGGQGADADYT
jgi:hypothetical protein